MAAHSATAAAQVPQQLREPFLEAVRAGRIRSMQNKLMPAAPIHTPGALLLGDAFNMRHPLTGTRSNMPPCPMCKACVMCCSWCAKALTGIALQCSTLHVLDCRGVLGLSSQ